MDNFTGVSQSWNVQYLSTKVIIINLSAKISCGDLWRI